MQRGAFALSLLLGACNQVYGLEPTKTVSLDADLRPDRDGDGIADVEDECIVAPSDSATDSDGDGIANAVDPCPLDILAGTDADGDGLGTCDPFPALPGDRTRCMMAFRNVDLNAALWQVRASDPPWNLVGGLEAPEGASTIIAATALEAPSATTYDALVLTGTLTIPAPPSTTFSMLARTGASSSGDVGCRVVRTSSMVTLEVVGGAAASESGAIVARIVRLRATVEATTSGPNLRCAVTVADGSGGTLELGPIAATAVLPSGWYGFAAQTSSGGEGSVGYQVLGLAIHDRIVAPLFP